MASKILVVFIALAAILSQGHTAAVVWLDDVTVTHISSAWHPKTIGIGYLYWIDKLVSCNVIFPNGVIYELYPTNTLTNVPTVSYVTGSAFDPGCSIAFSNSPPSMSGTYEIMSQVEHKEDGTQTLTRQKTHITFIMSEVVFPTADEEAVKADA